jgi:DNA mismatch endonuclease (patch repair protein)
MADVVDAQTRSRMMSGIKGKNTRPELKLRRALHRMGFRYRLHGKLPGRPDLVFPAFRAVIFVHGCFWHGHDCHLFKWPSSRVEFWREKIEGNHARDAVTCSRLHVDEWRILTVWECCLKGRTRWSEGEIAAAAANWLATGEGDLELRGLDDAGTCRPDRLDG